MPRHLRTAVSSLSAMPEGDASMDEAVRARARDARQRPDAQAALAHAQGLERAGDDAAPRASWRGQRG